MRSFRSWIVAGLLPFAALAQDAGTSKAPPPASPSATPEVDGPQFPFQEPLVDKMIGKWTITGTVTGKPATNTLTVEWTLNHQFALFHFRQPDPVPKGEVRYEAMVYVGIDHAEQKLVSHWLDVFGGRASETMGFGKKEGDALVLDFKYPDGPFHSVFAVEKDGSLHITISMQDASGKAIPFAEYRGKRSVK